MDRDDTGRVAFMTSTGLSNDVSLDMVADLAAQLRVDSIRSSTSAGSGHPTAFGERANQRRLNSIYIYQQSIRLFHRLGQHQRRASIHQLEDHWHGHQHRFGCVSICGAHFGHQRREFLPGDVALIPERAG